MRKFDIIVVGGGLSGCAAALAAARSGSDVLLVERINALGGAPCTMAINPFMRNATKIPETGETIQLSQGILSEITDALDAEGATRSNIFNPEYLKIILNRKLTEAGVTLLFNATLAAASRTDGRVTSVTLATKSGLITAEADYYIDATGDASLTCFAGFSTRLGRPGDGLCQPMTLCFSIGGVDAAEFDKVCDRIIPLWQEEKKKGKIKNPMDTIMVFHSCFPGIVNLNATRIIRRNPVDPFDVTAADIEAREQMVELHDFLRRCVPGFEKSMILSSAIETGVRESRMIDGEHLLTSEELVACTRFDDAIACGNYDIDIHNPEGEGTSHYFFPDGKYYTIPYRSLIPRGADNLLVAGRCISTTHEAQASIRIMKIVCTLGEAAGTAAALAAADSCSVRDVDITALRNTLISRGAFLGE